MRSSLWRPLSLAFLFDHLDLSFIEPMVKHAYSCRKRRPPHNVEAMFKALILKEVRQIPSRRKLAIFLKNDEFWSRKCGFNKPPHHDSFSKFIKRLGPELFTEIFNELVRQVQTLEAVNGEKIAVDSTTIKAYAKFYKNKKPSDPDARWGYSTTTGWVYGYKVHISCDAESELPIGFSVTPANKYDSKQYEDLLGDLTKRRIEFKHVIADAGYDTKKNYKITVEDYGAIPIIALNRRNLKKRSIKGLENDMRMNGIIRRNSYVWRSLYRKRSSAERVVSRLKEELSLKDLKVRGLEKVIAHVAISLIAMLSIAMVAFRTGNSNLTTSVDSFRF